MISNMINGISDEGLNIIIANTQQLIRLCRLESSMVSV